MEKSGEDCLPNCASVHRFATLPDVQEEISDSGSLVTYAMALYDSISGQTIWENNNGKNYHASLAELQIIAPGIKSFNPINAFTYHSFGLDPKNLTWILNGQVFANVEPVASGHTVSTFSAKPKERS